MSSTVTSTRPARSRKVRAILAGGVVLGVGAAVTLAAWSDSEFATGLFSAGSFNLEGSANGTAYDEHPAADAPASLAFSLPLAQNLAPEETVYAPFAVRLDDTTTSPADVALTVAGTTGVVAGLTYELIATSSFGCDATTTGTTIVPSGTALTAGTGSFDLAAGTAGAAGAPVNLCFAVSADSSLAQGQSGAVTWQFAATSAN
ncbi:putative ribosomally synthesized peptide with SipW-like signal peptide [Diaminobutyricimonas aerilata]|uniref:Putative ribosomally synthesized peptide with SipW-like signal peptide n=1 Tax=Diaminobutyricimonas aerilata TaxID=1162967 RepID=A0A2M9CG09_9MICO|nr:SipW-dependent-type signal peptide-containing protein [Diaminobutyricimonas aerilata]PJJ70782.1 putative ribosomally synthesized peptide with SipW-like signal peptide [Diaminobutyricimonas aerilata]